MESSFTLGVVPTLLISLAVYVYYAFSLTTIAGKTETGGGWMAWVPILNLLLMCRIAGRPGWWLVLMLIPLVNIVILLMLWMAIAEARGFASWWGIMMIVPFVNVIVPGYLAFAEGTEMPRGRPIHH
jgi:hypothetical protein